MRAATGATAWMFLVTGIVAAGLTHAQDYPVKNITFIVPYAAGGNGDIRGRFCREH